MDGSCSEGFSSDSQGLFPSQNLHSNLIRIEDPNENQAKVVVASSRNIVI